MTNKHLLLSTFIALATIFGTFFFVNVRRYEEIFIPGVEPKDVYGILSNFTNFFILEPNLIRFKLLAELNDGESVDVSKYTNYNEFENPNLKGTLDKNHNWGYIVWYEEFYQNLPSILTNKNEGKYIFSRPLKEEDAWLVTSYVTTDFLPGHPISTKCINSFKKVVKNEVAGTLLSENLNYEAPIMFLAIAYAEVEYQRPKILKAFYNWNYK